MSRPPKEGTQEEIVALGRMAVLFFSEKTLATLVTCTNFTKR